MRGLLEGAAPGRGISKNLAKGDGNGRDERGCIQSAAIDSAGAEGGEFGIGIGNPRSLKDG